jgi:hypothetical protein
MPLFEAGIALSLLALALFVAVHLVDRFRESGKDSAGSTR